MEKAQNPNSTQNPNSNKNKSKRNKSKRKIVLARRLALPIGKINNHWAKEISKLVKSKEILGQYYVFDKRIDYFTTLAEYLKDVYVLQVQYVNDFDVLIVVTAECINDQDDCDMYVYSYEKFE